MGFVLPEEHCSVVFFRWVARRFWRNNVHVCNLSWRLQLSDIYFLLEHSKVSGRKLMLFEKLVLKLLFYKQAERDFPSVIGKISLGHFNFRFHLLSEFKQLLFMPPSVLIVM